MFSNRTFLSIYKKAWKLNLKRYDEIEFINRSVARSGEKSGSWKGGKKLNKDGYFLLLNKNHHAYKNIDIKEMLDLRKNGEKVKNICKKYGISRNTYYKKEREFINDK